MSAVATTPKYAAVATTNNVSRPVGRLHPNQQSKAAVPRPQPSRSPCVQRQTPPSKRGSMTHEPSSSSSTAHEPRSSKAEDRVERAKKDLAKYVKDSTPTFIKQDKEWEEADGDKRAAGSEDADGEALWEEDLAFETKKKEVVETTVPVRRTTGRSRSPRPRPTFLGVQHRRPLDQNVKSHPWTQPSHVSKSDRADPPVNAQSPKRARSPRRRDSPPAVATVVRKQPQAPHANDVVRNAKKT